MSPYPIDKKFDSFNWNTIVIDGHDMDQIIDAFDQAEKTKGKPTAIIAKTVKGKGVSFMENVAGWHGKAPDQTQYEAAVSEIEAYLEEVRG
jgi:transketolase